MENISEIISNLPNSIDLEKARGINSNIQFSLSGDGGGDWAVKVDDGLVKVEPGHFPKPDLIIKASAADATSLLRGAMNPITAFMTGKIKIVGDMGLAMKLLNLLK